MEQLREASIDLLVDLARPAPSDAVLDYATGAGMAGFSIAPDVATVEAADELPDMLEEGKRLATELGLVNVAFTLVDLYALPYKDGQFHLVVCRNAFHLLPEPVSALQELLRVLAPGGRIVVLDPVVDETVDKAFNEIARLREPAHRRHYRADELEQIAARAGLAVHRARRGPAHHRPRLLAAGGRGAAAQGAAHPRPHQGAAGRGPDGPRHRILRQVRELQLRRGRTSGSNGREHAPGAAADVLPVPAGGPPPAPAPAAHRGPPRRHRPRGRRARRRRRLVRPPAAPVRLRRGLLRPVRLGPDGQSGSAATSPDGALTIVGAEDLWHTGPADLRFRDAEGKPTEASYRIDGGDWVQGKRAHVRGPADHSNDGMHTVEAKPWTAETLRASRSASTPRRPRSPRSRSRPTAPTARARSSFRSPRPPRTASPSSWAVVDVLGKPVGEQGEPAAPAGAVGVEWKVPAVDGEKLGPGTYWLRVRATDRAGNVTEERASLACVRPVKARIITDLPEAGNEVALTFDGGSGPAWHSQMDALYSRGALGTWFCTGVSVDRYPEIAQMAVEQGQSLGNHSYDHPDFSSISYEEQLSQLNRNTEAWWKACEAVPQPFFRPPYGSQTATTVKAAGDAGYRYVVMWNGDSGDWTGLSASAGGGQCARRRQAGRHHRLPHAVEQRGCPAGHPERPREEGPQGREPGAALRRRRPALLTRAAPGPIRRRHQSFQYSCSSSNSRTLGSCAPVGRREWMALSPLSRSTHIVS